MMQKDLRPWQSLQKARLHNKIAWNEKLPGHMWSGNFVLFQQVTNQVSMFIWVFGYCLEDSPPGPSFLGTSSGMISLGKSVCGILPSS